MKTRVLALATAGALAATAIQGPATAGVPLTAPERAAVAAAAVRADDDVVRRYLPPGAIVTDGQVTRLATVGEAVVVRGRFQQVGRYTGPLVAVEATTGAAAKAPALDVGMVSVAVPDGAGGWYAAGLFDQADDRARSSVVHVLADGSVDPAFRVEVDTYEGVYSLALAGGTLYLGGSFDRVNRRDRLNLAAVDAATGALRSFRRDVGVPVREIAYGISSGDRPARLYVGTREVVALDATTGAVDPTFVSPLPRRGKYELAVAGDLVYVGGNGVVALDADTGALDPTFDAGGLGQADDAVDDAVSTLVVDGDRLLVGGSFDTINGSDGPLAALDLTTGEPDPTFAPRVAGLGDADNRGVFDVAVSGDRLWIGGHFGTVDGSPARNLAVVDRATGARVPLTLPRPNGNVNTVDVSGDHVLVGGQFTMTAPLAARNIARLDAATLEPLTGGTTSLSPDADLVVDASVQVPSRQVLYSVTGSRVAAIDPVTGATRPALSHALSGIRAVSAGSGRLVVVQDTSPQVQFGRNRVVVFSSTTGKRLSSTRLSLRGYVTDARVVGDSVLVSGSFKRTVKGRAKNLAVLRWDLRGKRVVPGFDPHLNGPVYDISDTGPVVVSGLFTEVDEDLPRIARDHPGLARLGESGTPSRRFVNGVTRGVGNDITLLGVDSRRFGFTDLSRGPYAGTTFRSALTGGRIPDPTGRYGVSWTIPHQTGGFVFAGSSADYVYGPGVEYVAVAR